MAVALNMRLDLSTAAQTVLSALLHTAGTEELFPDQNSHIDSTCEANVHYDTWEIVRESPWVTQRMTLGRMIDIANQLNHMFVRPDRTPAALIMHISRCHTLDECIERLLCTQKLDGLTKPVVVFVADSTLQSLLHTPLFNHWYLIVIGESTPPVIIDSTHHPGLGRSFCPGSRIREHTQKSKCKRLYTGHQTSSDSCGYWALLYAYLILDHTVDVDAVEQLMHLEADEGLIHEIHHVFRSIRPERMQATYTF